MIFKEQRAQVLAMLLTWEIQHERIEKKSTRSKKKKVIDRSHCNF